MMNYTSALVYKKKMRKIVTLRHLLKLEIGNATPINNLIRTNTKGPNILKTGCLGLFIWGC